MKISVTTHEARVTAPEETDSDGDDITSSSCAPVSDRAPKRSKRVAKDTNNAFFKSSSNTASDLPSEPQDTPRYVTRQTAREMAKASEETTKMELAKLGMSDAHRSVCTTSSSSEHVGGYTSKRCPNPNMSKVSSHSGGAGMLAHQRMLGGADGRSGSGSGGSCSRGGSAAYLYQHAEGGRGGGCAGGLSGSIHDASFTEPPPPAVFCGVDQSAHRLMQQYAEKQCSLCDQISVLNHRLQTTQDQFMRLKETFQNTRTEYEDQIAHLNEVTNSYDEEVKALTDDLNTEREKNATLETTCKQARDSFNTLLYSALMMCLSGLAMANLYSAPDAATDPFQQHSAMLAEQAADNMSNATEWVSSMFGVV
jgi:hypothetical protein